MSLPDPSRAYHSGVIAVALNTAQEALTTAFVSAITVEDMDGPLVSAISRAQTEVKTAQGIEVDWHAPVKAVGLKSTCDRRPSCGCSIECRDYLDRQGIAAPSEKR